MNYLEKIIGNPILRIKKTVGKLDYRMLMCNPDFNFDITHADIIEQYDYYNTHKWLLFNRDAIAEQGNKEAYMYQKIRQKLLSMPFSKNDIVDALVYGLFTERKSSLKKTFWECFGKEVYENLQKNVPSDSRICPICGNRIFAEDIVKSNQVYCSEECRLVAYRESNRKSAQNIRVAKKSQG